MKTLAEGFPKTVWNPGSKEMLNLQCFRRNLPIITPGADDIYAAQDIFDDLSYFIVVLRCHVALLEKTPQISQDVIACEFYNIFQNWVDLVTKSKHNDHLEFTPQRLDNILLQNSEALGRCLFNKQNVSSDKAFQIATIIITDIVHILHKKFDYSISASIFIIAMRIVNLYPSSAPSFTTKNERFNSHLSGGLNDDYERLIKVQEILPLRESLKQHLLQKERCLSLHCMVLMRYKALRCMCQIDLRDSIIASRKHNPDLKRVENLLLLIFIIHHLNDFNIGCDINPPFDQKKQILFENPQFECRFRKCAELLQEIELKNDATGHSSSKKNLHATSLKLLSFLLLRCDGLAQTIADLVLTGQFQWPKSTWVTFWKCGSESFFFSSHISLSLFIEQLDNVVCSVLSLSHIDDTFLDNICLFFQSKLTRLNRVGLSINSKIRKKYRSFDFFLTSQPARDSFACHRESNSISFNVNISGKIILFFTIQINYVYKEFSIWDVNLFNAFVDHKAGTHPTGRKMISYAHYAAKQLKFSHILLLNSAFLSIYRKKDVASIPASLLFVLLGRSELSYYQIFGYKFAKEIDRDAVEEARDFFCSSSCFIVI